MHDEKNPEETDAGLGRVIYSVGNDAPEACAEAKKVAQREVEIAERESFPASDPPGYSGGSTGDPE